MQKRFPSAVAAGRKGDGNRLASLQNWFVIESPLNGLLLLLLIIKCNRKRKLTNYLTHPLAIGLDYLRLG